MATKLKTVEDALNELPSGLALLRQPFPEHQVSKLPKPTKKDAPKGKCKPKRDGGDAPDWQEHFCGGYHGLPAVHLDYVGHAALTDRLLDADPEWSWEPLGFTPEGLPALDRNGGLWIKLTVCGVTRFGYGSADGKSGGDAQKEMIGDALRNAAMRFGAALDLWHKGDLHADEEGENVPKNDNGRQARQAEARDAPFPQGPCKNKTALKDAGRALWADVMACDDKDSLDALLASQKPLVDQLKAGLPQWWEGGVRPVDGGGEETYEGLGQVIDKLERDFTAVMESGADWRGNPITAG